MRTVIVENTWLMGINKGWGNGYVVIPKESFLHGTEYTDDIFNDIEVNGGLTFSNLIDDEMVELWKVPHSLTKDDIGKWLIGFDTCHSWDTAEMWPKEKVQEEADKLLAQLQEISNPSK